MGSELAFVKRFKKSVVCSTKRFAKQDDGVTIIEFSLLALPFFALIGAILEVGLFLLASQVFDSAVDDAARAILVGEAKGYEASDFRGKICEHTFGLVDCAGIKLRSRPIKTFSEADTTDPVDKDGKWTIVETFNAGSGRQVILVEAYYKWNTLLGFDYGFSKFGNSTMLSSARVFMNEPF